MTMEHETGRSSLSVTQNAKGAFQLSGKVYAQGGVNVEAAFECVCSEINGDPYEAEGDVVAEQQEALAALDALDTIRGRVRYLESLVDLDGARQEMVRQIDQAAQELRGKGFTIAGDA
ncbi:MAG: hypothetical protein O3B04_10230 [Chloroflexi bacterium]|nr:hypothetical protein [Chloroflexota bacterium]